MKTIFFSLAIMLVSSINAFCATTTNPASIGNNDPEIKSIVIKTDESNLADLQKMAADFDKAHQVRECEISLTATVKMGALSVEIGVTVSAESCTEATKLAMEGLSDAKKAIMSAWY